MSNSRPGWYPDPSGDQSKLRYWDGEKWTDSYADSPSMQPVVQRPSSSSYEVSSDDSTLRLIAFVFCIVSTVSTCWLIVPLAWMIPMTVVCWGIYKGTRPNTTGFAICTLLFVTLVGGILLLVSKKDR